MLLTKIKEIRNGRVITKDAKTKHEYKGYVLEWDNENNKIPAKIISPKKEVIFTYAIGAEPTITGFNSKVDAHLSKDAVDPTKPKNIAAAKNLSVAQGKAASDGGPGSGQKGHKSAHRIPDPSTHQERRKERANLQKYIENARRSGNIKEAQKHSQRLAHINSLQLKG